MTKHAVSLTHTGSVFKRRSLGKEFIPRSDSLFNEINRRTIMINVITYGTFDLFHPGHVRLLERAKELGDRLSVGLSTDDFNTAKGKRSIMTYDQRRQVLSSCRYVDIVFPEIDWDQKVKDIKNRQIDIFVMGDDWRGKFDHLNLFCDVVYLPRTEGISTTALKAASSALCEL